VTAMCPHSNLLPYLQTTHWTENCLGSQIIGMTQASTVTNKLTVLFLLLVIDLGMNCSFDFDSYELNGKDLIAVPLVIQLVIQISIFLILFLSMAGTYLFRVGLLGILIKKFRSVLLLHGLYVSLTLITGAYRIYLLGVDYDLVKLWEHDGFVALSLIQKCGLLISCHCHCLLTSCL
jgi:hypothetical protein